MPFAKVSVGGGQTLNLVKMRVTTHVEGLRARTLVDHIYQNPFDKALEGTFSYSLPAEAGVAYFGMLTGVSTQVPNFFGQNDPSVVLSRDEFAKLFPEKLAESADKALWSGLKPARVVRAVEATIAYEDVAIKKVDPALVEQVAPGAFQARVFPIPAKGFNRVLVSYEQTLPRVGGALEYRFPIPKGVVPEFELSIAATKETCSSGTSVGSVADVVATESSQHLFFDKKVTGVSPGGVVAVQLQPAKPSDEIDAVSGTDASTGQSYFYARVSPSLPQLLPGDGGAKHGVFLLDTSLSEHPDRFGVSLKLLQGILEASPKMTAFKIMTFDAGARWLEGTWIENTPAARAAVLAKLSGVLLEGSTDFGSALRLLATPSADLAGVGAVDAFLLSDGAISWGDAGAENLVAKYQAQAPFATRFFAYRTGLGAENLELYSALTRRGAIFNCLSADSVPACSVAHHGTGAVLTSVSVETLDGKPAANDVFVAGRQAMLFPGSFVTIGGRVLQPGPAVVRMQGTSPAGPLDVSVPVDLEPSGALAPRAWAELAVSQITASREPSLEGLAMALSQRYGITSRLASFLMLETSAAYQQWNLPDETAKFQGQTIGALVEAAFVAFTGKYSSWDRLKGVLDRFDNFNHLKAGAVVASVASGANPEELEVPDPTLSVPLVMKGDVPSTYLSTMSQDQETVTPFLGEADRRSALGQKGAAVRALSSLVENNPGNAQMERLVGYRMAGWGGEADASSLFFHVLERRPFEPQSYRDLANVLGTARPRLATMLYEAVASGTWETKHGMLVPVVKEEYAMFVDRLVKTQPSHPLNDYLAMRKSQLGLVAPTGDLRVTITWNTDDTDIDLWVVDPSGEKCFYSHPSTSHGGKLLADLTNGYGPERFEAKSAMPGVYKVYVHYFANKSNALYAFSYVNVAVTTHVGTPDEQVDHYVVPLKKVGEQALVTEVGFK